MSDCKHRWLSVYWPTGSTVSEKQCEKCGRLEFSGPLDSRVLPPLLSVINLQRK